MALFKLTREDRVEVWVDTRRIVQMIRDSRGGSLLFLDDNKGNILPVMESPETVEVQQMVAESRVISFAGRDLHRSGFPWFDDFQGFYRVPLPTEEGKDP